MKQTSVSFAMIMTTRAFHQLRCFENALVVLHTLIKLGLLRVDQQIASLRLGFWVASGWVCSRLRISMLCVAALQLLCRTAHQRQAAHKCCQALYTATIR